MDQAKVDFTQSLDDLERATKDVSKKRKRKKEAEGHLLDAMKAAKQPRILVGNRVLEIVKKPKKPAVTKTFLSASATSFFSTAESVLVDREPPEVRGARLAQYVFQCVEDAKQEEDGIKPQKSKKSNMELLFEGLPAAVGASSSAAGTLGRGGTGTAAKARTGKALARVGPAGASAPVRT